VPTAASPSFCPGSTAIAATDVSSPISLGSCPIEGQAIVISLPGGRTAGGSRCRRPGGEVINSVLTTRGEYEPWAATDNRGAVTVNQSIAADPAARARALATPAVAALPGPERLRDRG